MKLSTIDKWLDLSTVTYHSYSIRVLFIHNNISKPEQLTCATAVSVRTNRTFDLSVHTFFGDLQYSTAYTNDLDYTHVSDTFYRICRVMRTAVRPAVSPI